MHVNLLLAWTTCTFISKNYNLVQHAFLLYKSPDTKTEPGLSEEIPDSPWWAMINSENMIMNDLPLKIFPNHLESIRLRVTWHYHWKDSVRYATNYTAAFEALIARELARRFSESSSSSSSSLSFDFHLPGVVTANMSRIQIWYMRIASGCSSWRPPINGNLMSFRECNAHLHQVGIEPMPFGLGVIDSTRWATRWATCWQFEDLVNMFRKSRKCVLVAGGIRTALFW